MRKFARSHRPSAQLESISQVDRQHSQAHCCLLWRRSEHSCDYYYIKTHADCQANHHDQRPRGALSMPSQIPYEPPNRREDDDDCRSRNQNLRQTQSTGDALDQLLVLCLTGLHLIHSRLDVRDPRAMEFVLRDDGLDIDRSVGSAHVIHLPRCWAWPA